MGERALHVKVGIGVLTAALIVVGFLFYLGNYTFKDTFVVEADFDFVGNLSTGAPVKVAGVKVGRVDDIVFLGGRVDERTKQRVYVRVRMKVEQRARLAVRTDSRVFINTQGMLGEQYIEIEPGNPDAANSREWALGMPPLHGAAPPRLDLLMSRTYTLLDETLKMLESERPTLIKGLRETAGLLEFANQQLSLHKDDVTQLLHSSKEMLEEMAKSIHIANVILGDGKEIKTLLGSTQRLIRLLDERLPRLLDTTENTLHQAQAAAQLVGPKERDRLFASLDQAMRLADLAERMANEGLTLLKKINAGEGTAGALVIKRDVYEDLRELVRDLRENPWKLFWKD